MSTNAVARRIDEECFHSHLEQGPFVSGVDRARWRLIEVAWPCAILGISAAPRGQSPSEYGLRFQLSNYPQVAPTARLWDLSRNQPLPPPEWPGGRLRIPAAFNPGWKGGECLYLPCDRCALEGHDVWRTQHPDMIWSPTDDITKYLRIVHELLNSSDYTGRRG